MYVTHVRPRRAHGWILFLTSNPSCPSLRSQPPRHVCTHTCLGGWADSEGQLGFTAVVHGETFKEERAEAGPGAAAGGVVRKEALEAGAVVGELADAVEDKVHNLLAYRRKDGV